MPKYKITFSVDYGGDQEDSRIVQTDLNPKSDEFSRFIADQATDMGTEAMESYFDNAAYEDEYNHPTIEVVQLAGDPFCPKGASKYWADHWIEYDEIQEENRKKYRIAKKEDDYLRLKLENGDASPTHRLKKDRIIRDTYMGKEDENENKGLIPKGSLAMLGNMTVWFLDEDNKILKYESPWGERKALWSIRVDYSESGGSYYDMFLPLEDWFEEID